MSGMRAKDADRERCVALIDEAYVDGQLDADERERRVAAALAAQTLDDLDALTRDLQPNPSAPRPNRRALLIAGGAVATGGILAAWKLWPDPAVPPTPAAPPPIVRTKIVEVPVTPSPTPTPTPTPTPEPTPEPPEFTLTAASIQDFLKRYEEKFGTLDAYQLSLDPDQISAEVPVRGSRPRYERWTWDGTWRRDSEPSAVLGGTVIFDLGTLNAQRFMDNIELAKAQLNVQRGHFAHAIAQVRTGEGVAINILIDNRFSESGILKTTLPGDIILRWPYEG